MHSCRDNPRRNDGTKMFTSYFHIFAKLTFSSHCTTQTMVVRQNILSNLLLKNDKLSNEDVRLQLAIPEICQTTNSSTNCNKIERNKTALLIYWYRPCFAYKTTSKLSYIGSANYLFFQLVLISWQTYLMYDLRDN